MNILFIGGNHKLCINLIYNLLNKNNKFNITILDNQRNLYKSTETVNHHFEYLKGDIYNYYYGNIEDKELIFRICKNHDINIIINNVKYNVLKNFEENYNSQTIGNFNILSAAKEYNMYKIINIIHNFSSNYYNLTKYNDLKKNMSFFILYNSNLADIMKMCDKTYNIIYYDNLYYNNYELTNANIEKYIYSFKIGDKPYVNNINMNFVNSDSVVNAIISCIKNMSFSLNYTIHGTKVNIQNELIPTIINYIKQSKPDIQCLYHLSENEKIEPKLILFTDLNKAICQSIKNIFE